MLTGPEMLAIADRIFKEGEEMAVQLGVKHIVIAVGPNDEYMLKCDGIRLNELIGILSRGAINLAQTRTYSNLNKDETT